MDGPRQHYPCLKTLHMSNKRIEPYHPCILNLFSYVPPYTVCFLVDIDYCRSIENSP